MKALLELFSGTGSVGKAFKELGWEVISVDIDTKSDATIHKDILHLEPADIPKKPDFIWASPPCTMYSIARTNAKIPRDLEGSDALVQRTLALVEHYQAPFMMENPHSGLLKTRAVVAGIPMRVLDYCRWGTPYRKRTSIWTNTSWSPSKTLCNFDCASSIAGLHGRKVHLANAQQGSAGGRPGCSLDQLHALPSGLCREIAEFADRATLVARLSAFGRHSKPFEH